MKQQKPMSLIDSLFQQAEKETKKEAKEKREKKTLRESRKAREARTARNILHVKHRLEDENERLLRATFHRDHIRAVIETSGCPQCDNETRQASLVEIWSKGKTRNGTEVLRCTAIIRSASEYMYNSHLPLQLSYTSTTRICADCLEQDKVRNDSGEEKPPCTRQLWRPEYTIAKLEATNEELEKVNAELRGEVARLQTALRKSGL